MISAGGQKEDHFAFRKRARIHTNTHDQDSLCSCKHDLVIRQRTAKEHELVDVCVQVGVPLLFRLPHEAAGYEPVRPRGHVCRVCRRTPIYPYLWGSCGWVGLDVRVFVIRPKACVPIPQK